MAGERHYYIESIDIDPRSRVLQVKEGTEHEATVDLLPFIDKEKQLPRAAWGGGGQ